MIDQNPVFLCAPPFPWVPPAAAAVAVPGTSAIADPDALVAALAEARVGGGPWWNEQDDPWRSDASPADGDRAIVAWLAGRGGDAAALRARLCERISSAAYRDPFTDAESDPIAAIRTLGRWRQTLAANRGIASAVGMAAWKRAAIERFLWDGAHRPRFASADAAVAAGGIAAYWPSRAPADFARRMAAAGGAAWTVEDGLIRSNGLGAECRPPQSILVDPLGGIHFDPDRPSALEAVLADHPFDDALRARAARLRARIVAARLGKYGVDRGAPPSPALPRGRRIVVAIGQVSDDLSVRRAGAGIAGNHGFLARVRAADPDAYLVYRPHPDVLAGLRRGALADPVANGLADRVEAGGSLLALIEQADAVHVLSSLTGFEALLRGCEVVVHGAPFYAGWGLTRDLAPLPARRQRRLTLDELVAGALIVAPRYLDPVTGLPCEAETLVDRLAEDRAPRHGLVTGFRRVYGATRRRIGGGRIKGAA